MTATAHRSRLGSCDLRVVSAAGTTAAFAAELSAERKTLIRRRSQRRWLRGLHTLLHRRRPRGSRGRLRRVIALAVLCGVALSVYLLNADTALQPKTEAVGSSAVAAAGCAPGWLENTPVIGDFSEQLNNFCDVVGGFAANLVDTIGGAIADIVGSAVHPNRFCLGSRVALSPEDPNEGINSLLTRGVSFVFGVDKADATTATTWNQYGIAGAGWNTYYLDCWFEENHLVNTTASLVLWGSKVLSMVAILLFQQTFNSQIVDYFFLPQDGAPKSSIDEIMQDLNTQIYVEFFAVAVVLGALVLLYNNVIRGQGSKRVELMSGAPAGHVCTVGCGDGKHEVEVGSGGKLRGSGLSDALSKIGIMVAVAAFAALFVNYGSGYVRDANAYTNEIGEVVLTALAGTDCTNSDGEAVSTTPYDCVAQTLYDTLVFRPWASGNIGEIEVLNNEAQTDTRRRLAMRMLRQNAYTVAESAELASPATSAERRLELFDLKQNDRTVMVKNDWGAKYISKDSQRETRVEDGEEKDAFDPNSWRPYDHVQTARPEYWELWSGHRGDQRLLTAGLAMIASFTLGMVMISIAVAYLTLQLITVMLAMTAPIVFLLALIPGIGLRLLLRWGELFIGVFLKRVAVVVFVGVLL
ncbi:MAG: hypothetical protein ACRDPW_07565, partial [Mycobacteriales bacterium]